MRLRFVVPADVASPTGGNVYDLAAAAGLRRAGVEVDLIRVGPSDLAAALKPPWSDATLVDGLLACAQPEAVEASRVGVLVHMPLVWQSHLPPDQAAAEVAEREHRALRAADPVIATSEWTARFLRGVYGLERVAVAAPGVEAAAVVAGSDPPLLVQLAALAPHKDQLGVVKALESLKDLRWRARLAGSVDRDPAYAALVRDEVAGCGLTDRIEIPGEMDRELAWDGADLALLPSRAEAFGMVVTEALARGIPAVVASGGAAEALGFDSLGNRPGIVIEPGDPAGLAEVLRGWLVDHDHREALRTSALARRGSLQGWEVTAECLRDTLFAPL